MLKTKLYGGFIVITWCKVLFIIKNYGLRRNQKGKVGKQTNFICRISKLDLQTGDYANLTIKFYFFGSQ